MTDDGDQSFYFTFLLKVTAVFIKRNDLSCYVLNASKVIYFLLFDLCRPITTSVIY